MDLDGDEQKTIVSPSHHCSALACSRSTIHLIDKHTPQSLTATHPKIQKLVLRVCPFLLNFKIATQHQEKIGTLRRACVYCKRNTEQSEYARH